MTQEVDSVRGRDSGLERGVLGYFAPCVLDSAQRLPVGWRCLGRHAGGQLEEPLMDSVRTP